MTSEVKTDERYRAFMADCCRALEVELEDVLGSRRESGPVMNARHAMGWLLRERYGLSYPHMGRVLRRDHTTVMHSVKKFALALEARQRWAVTIAGLAGCVGRAMLELEGPLDSLRSCSAGIELEAVGA